MTRLQLWTLVGAVVVGLGVLGCEGDPPSKQNAPPADGVCIDPSNGHEVQCKGTVVAP